MGNYAQALEGYRGSLKIVEWLCDHSTAKVIKDLMQNVQEKGLSSG
jgi:hypothetical protein